MADKHALAYKTGWLIFLLYQITGLMARFFWKIVKICQYEPCLRQGNDKKSLHNLGKKGKIEEHKRQYQ
ncbi:hypothetical protein D7X87_09535 [bacterium D16-54]|nr:hypothetical protein D7X87_09535 [bacterium D16-54]